MELTCIGPIVSFKIRRHLISFLVLLQESKVQKGGNDCGVFLCAFANALALQLPITGIQMSNIPNLRKKMKEEVERGILTPLTFGRNGKVILYQEVKEMSLIASVNLALWRCRLVPISRFQNHIYILSVQVATVEECKIVELRTKLNGVLLLQSATIHQRDVHRFGGRANLQCSMIAAVAIATLAQITTNVVSRGLLDDIIIEGDKLFTSQLERKGSGLVWLSPNDLPCQVDVLNNVVGLESIICGHGHLNCESGNHIEDAIKTGSSFLRNTGNQYGFIFTSQGKSVGFLPSGMKRFLLFNSHSVDRDNRVKMTAAGGAAIPLPFSLCC